MSMYRLRNDEVLWSKVGDDIVMLELASSTYFTVRGSGTAIIEKLADGTSEDSLVEHVIGCFEVDAAVAKADVVRFLKELSDKNLLTTVE